MLVGRVCDSRPALGLEEGVEGAGQRLSFSIPRGRKAREGEKRRKLPGAGRTKIKKMGRKRERLQAAHRCAGVEIVVSRVFVSGRILEKGCIIEGTEQSLCFSSGF